MSVLPLRATTPGRKKYPNRKQKRQSIVSDCTSIFLAIVIYEKSQGHYPFIMWLYNLLSKQGHLRE